MEAKCPKCGEMSEVSESTQQFPCWDCKMLYHIDSSGNIMSKTFDELGIISYANGVEKMGIG